VGVPNKHVNSRDIFGTSFELKAINPARLGSANRLQKGAVEGWGVCFLFTSHPSRTGWKQGMKSFKTNLNLREKQIEEMSFPSYVTTRWREGGTGTSCFRQKHSVPTQARSFLNWQKRVVALWMRLPEAVPVTGGAGLWTCEMLRISHCLDSPLTDGSTVVSPSYRPRSTPQKRYFSASSAHLC
jgi:hypothetical protein